jgi:hypothetical protein
MFGTLKAKFCTALALHYFAVSIESLFKEVNAPWFWAPFDAWVLIGE